MIIAVINTKGGSSKSTVAFQVVASMFLYQKKSVKLIEFDDENRDSETFSNSKIESTQIEIGNGDDLDNILRDTLLSDESENLVIDVGGNKTTTLIIDGLRKTRLYRKIDLFIIPMSGGYQDLINAKKSFEMVKQFNVPTIFALSRVRNPKRLHFQYGEFFRLFPNEKYFILTDSDVIDLSRTQKKSVYEIAYDTQTKKAFEDALDKAFDDNDNKKIGMLSTILQIFDESEIYFNDILKPTFKMINNLIENSNG